MSKSTRGKVTLLDILELKLKSCRNLFKCMHSVSGKTVTREYFKPFLSFLPEKKDVVFIQMGVSDVLEMLHNC